MEGVASSAALAGLPQQADALLSQLAVAGLPARIPQVLQLAAELGHQPAQQPQSATASLLSSDAAQRQSGEDDASESEVPTDGDGSTGSKRKAPSSQEEKRKRRQEINRKSARRIRDRRSQEAEDLKRQVAHLQHQLQLLLPYAAQITRDKDILVWPEPATRGHPQQTQSAKQEAE
ncbi:hypothetical protein WJX72_007913 [[Myrmecia] bisecta]|uniref:BZIP domain-containing protein n=1 Tax=[Myrmecia] bisecta TaxID=41462 RepID=A0AAW1PGK0_9CHLO